MEQVDMKSQFGDCNPAAVDFLEKLIQFDPDKRMTVEQALAHPYLESYHVESVEPNHSSPLNFSFERENDLDNLRILISDLNYSKEYYYLVSNSFGFNKHSNCKNG